MGATAGRTTLLGEGLQHQDGHSLVLASTVPPVQAYDPAFAYEVGRDRAGTACTGCTGPTAATATSSTTSPSTTRTTRCRRCPSAADRRTQVIRGPVPVRRAAPDGPSKRATMLFSGIAHGAAQAAAVELAERYDVGVELWSATSYKALREEALAVERWNRLHPTAGAARAAGGPQLLADDARARSSAVSDFMKIVPEQVARFLPGRHFMPLGTDGMGRSDTREALRRFFEIDMGHVVVGVLPALWPAGPGRRGLVADAIKRYDIDPDAADPYIV